jgi:hypothetical protein
MAGGILKRKAQVAVNLESTEGTAIALGAADAAFYVYEASFEPDIQITERNPLRSTLTNLAHFSGRRSGRITFKTELVGSGTAGTAPAIGEALKACGMKHINTPGTSDAYKPTSVFTAGGNGSSATVGLFIDGLRYAIFGARGTVKLSYTAGEPAYAEFDFLGVISSTTAVDDVALLTGITYPAATPPIFLNATVTKESSDLVAENFSIDLGNELALRPDVTSENGYLSTKIVGRTPTGSCDPELNLVADRDDYGDLFDATGFDAVCEIGSTAGNTITVTNASNGAILSNVSLSDRNGIMVAGLDFALTSTSASGDDELVLTFA